MSDRIVVTQGFADEFQFVGGHQSEEGLNVFNLVFGMFHFTDQRLTVVELIQLLLKIANFSDEVLDIVQKILKGFLCQIQDVLGLLFDKLFEHFVLAILYRVLVT